MIPIIRNKLNNFTIFNAFIYKIPCNEKHIFMPPYQLKTESAGLEDCQRSTLSMEPHPASYIFPLALVFLLGSVTAYVSISCCLLSVRCGYLLAHANRSRVMFLSAVWNTYTGCQLCHRNCRLLQFGILLQMGDNADVLKIFWFFFFFSINPSLGGPDFFPLI